MTTAATAGNSIDTATTLLQAELPQLEEHQQALQAELATVSERLESVRGALTALSALSATTVPRPRAAEPNGHVATEVTTATIKSAAAAVESQEPATAAAVVTDEPAVTPRRTAPRKARKAGSGTTKSAASKPANKPTGRRPATKPTQAKTTKKAKQSQGTSPAETVQDAGGLTEQVMAVLAREPGVPLRARNVAEALGRGDSTAAINTVRSTLDRLVATSRAQRAGRGLYNAPAA